MTSFWKRLSLKVIIAIAAGASALVLLVIIVLLYVLKKKGSKGNRSSRVNGFAIGRYEDPKDDYSSGIQATENKKLVFLDGCCYNFDLDDLLRASAEILGKGTYGTTYRAVLEDATTVVVKRLKDVGIGKREFVHQMEMIGTLGKHPNVAPLRAYYYSKDEKLIVYDYTSTRSLSNVLHGDGVPEWPPLDWASRLRIAVAVAHGVAHIHGAKGGRLFHGNIKSSNVLLTRELDACITDFGLAVIITPPDSPSWVAEGYGAPETIQTRRFTQKSDVYSFGVMLLEMLTGKAPLDRPAYGDAVDLPRWVQCVVREEWTAEVFDAELMRYRNIEEELLQILQIAMACVAGDPDQRPDIHQVIEMIQEAWLSDSSYCTSSELTPGRRV